MYRDYRVVAFTPAGRKRTMSILIDYLSVNRDIVDEYQVWLNTDEDQTEDTEWLLSLPDLYDWVTVIERPRPPLSPKQLNTGLFYPNTIDENTIYVRFDDDIVYIDEHFFPNLLDFRIDNPDYFLVFANIWNNAVLGWIHQELGHTSFHEQIKEPFCMDEVGWRSPKYAEYIHRLLIDKIETGSTEDLLFDHAVMNDAQRFSISCFAFFGKDFAKFDGVVGIENDAVRWDEEIWLTEVYPTLENKKSAICGSALVSHYSFFAQRPYLDNTDILETYRKISKETLSDNYYALLEQSQGKTTQREGYVPNDTVVELPETTWQSQAVEVMRAKKEGWGYEFDGSGTIITFNGEKRGRIGTQRGRMIDSKILGLRRKYAKR